MLNTTDYEDIVALFNYIDRQIQLGACKYTINLDYDEDDCPSSIFLKLYKKRLETDAEFNQRVDRVIKHRQKLYREYLRLKRIFENNE